MTQAQGARVFGLVLDCVYCAKLFNTNIRLLEFLQSAQASRQLSLLFLLRLFKDRDNLLGSPLKGLGVVRSVKLQSMKQAIRRFAGQSSKPQRASKSTSRQPDLENFQYDPITLKSPGEIVYLEYNPVELPPKPAEDWTRFVCISDTHSRSFPVPDGDVLLHSGDLTNTGTVSDFEVTMKWLYSLPHKVKMWVCSGAI
jgi:hypothetical protein